MSQASNNQTQSNLDTPLKYISVIRRDMPNCGWNECPTCKNSIGYHPLQTGFRCPKCGQRILWE